LLGNWSSEVRQPSVFVEATAASVAGKAPFARAGNINLLATRVFVSTMEDHPMTDPGGSGHRKRIVVCFDGTANQIGAGNLTNVAKLFDMLNKADPNSQLAYCDPGVGTLAPASAQSAIWCTASLLFMRAVVRRMKAHVAQAYRCLMQH
jgi:hypothetical protein